jgi:hypothetical protein
MKTTITILLLFSGLVFAQTVSDSSGKGRSMQEREQLQSQEREMKTVQDQIGPKENLSADGKTNRKKKDVFIDKDGDGICDSRQSGMSFNQMRKRMGSGQKGPGKGQHGSGHGNQSGNGNGGKN